MDEKKGLLSLALNGFMAIAFVFQKQKLLKFSIVMKGMEMLESYHHQITQMQSKNRLI